MNDTTLILLFICFIPLFTALVGAIIERISMQDSVTIREKRVKRLLMCYFITFILIGSGVSTGVALPEVATQIWPFTVFALYMAPVLFYRFICILSDIENEESNSFNKHYLFPLFAGIGCCTLYYIVPLPVRLQLIEDRTIVNYPVSTFIFQTIPVVQFVLTVIYTLLAFRKLSDTYRHHTDSVQWKKWLHLSVFLCILSLIWSGAFLFTIWRHTAIPALVIAIIAAWMQAVFLCCNTFNRKSLLFLPLTIAPIPLQDSPNEWSPESNNIIGEKRTHKRRKQTASTAESEQIPLKRKHFEKEVVAKKLYLNPQLRLSALTEVFHTNRTYLSNFINQTYGCGFNEYINRLRLGELERLMSLPRNQGKSAKKLCLKAGFPNYRTYLRAKKPVCGEDITNNTPT